ncbi:cytochrome d oxidase subunit CydB [Streptomyces sp. BK022]|nr:cytochrome d oxidase subunit CydB [Streptomyces sp. BK022]
MGRQRGLAAVRGRRHLRRLPRLVRHPAQRLYLPFLLILGCLILRGVAFEYRHKRGEERWQRNWEHTIFWCSLIPAFLWGVIFTDIVRGVPIGADHDYAGDLGDLVGGYALLGGIVTLALFTFHGAVFATLKTLGDVRVRARSQARVLGLLTLALGAPFLIWTQAEYGGDRSLVAVVVAGVALAAALLLNGRGREGWAFGLSGTAVVAAFASLFLSLFPDVMPSTLDPAWSLTVTNAASGHYTLTIMTWVALIFTPLVMSYQAFTYWVFRRRIGVQHIPGATTSAAHSPKGTAMSPAHAAQPPRILIVGGGYAGLYTALRVLKKLRGDEATVTVVDPRSYMTYLPFLPEAAGGNVADRNLVAPLRTTLKKAEVVTGHVVAVDHTRKTATIVPPAGDEYELGFDYLVVATGSVSRTFPIPGLAQHGIGLKTVEEAVSLRNHVLWQLDKADSTTDPEARRKALTFVFVGGGFAGVEAVGEIEDMCRDAAKNYRNIGREDMRFILVEAANRILPEMGPDLGVWTKKKLEERGVEVYLNTSMESCTDQQVLLKNGVETPASTIVWTAGVKPSPLLTGFGLPLGPRGHIDTAATLQVQGFDYVWSAGDNAQVPDLAVGDGAWCPPNAQHAYRQAKVLGDNIVARLRGRRQKEYKHANLGAVASIGLHKGVAIMFGKIKLKGLPAWWFHRLYHGAMMPTVNRKVRVFLDWTLAVFLRRETVGLPEMAHPRDAFIDAALPEPQLRRAERGNGLSLVTGNDRSGGVTTTP